MNLKKGFNKIVVNKWMVVLLKFAAFAILKKVLMTFVRNIEKSKTRNIKRVLKR